MAIAGETELNLNGHTVSATSSSPLLQVSGGSLTLKGEGNVSNTGCVGYAANGGTITVKDGSYYSSTKSAFTTGADGTVVVDGGHIIGREGAVTNYGGNGTMVINDGDLTTLDNFVVATNGSEGMGQNYIEINGGVLTGNIQSPGYEAIGVYVANDDVLVMNGGEILANGGTGLLMRGGDVTINNGTIMAMTADEDGKIGDDPTVLTGTSAIVYHQTAHYPGNGNMKLTVNGGTLFGSDHSIQVLSDEAEPQVFVNGGDLTPPYEP